MFLPLKIYSGCVAAVMALTACGCTGKSVQQADNAAHTPSVQTQFIANADSLLAAVAAQTRLGPRTPGSDAHRLCGDLIINRLHAAGIDSVAVQLAVVDTPDGKHPTARNILGSINPDATERVLLLAHYDTRPTADNDPDPSLRSTPIDGANDGASGVAVLLEIARLLGRSTPHAVGIDLLFTDVEDSGESGMNGGDDTWCLGTQQWVRQMPYTSANKPRYGILLDMVGGRDARFHREHFSDRMAPAIVNRVWAVARESGFGDRFINSPGAAVIDDHIHIGNAGIPCIDIIESLNEHTGSFNPTWHTSADRLEAIDPETLKAVAQTVVNTIIKP